MLLGYTTQTYAARTGFEPEIPLFEQFRIAQLLFYYYYFYLFFFGGGATALSGPGPPHSRGFQIKHNDTPQSVGHLWTSDQLVAETLT